MIRSSAILLLIITGVLASVPPLQTHSSSQSPVLNNLPSVASDPSGPLSAFNYTYSQANLYTRDSTTPPTGIVAGTALNWMSTFNRTRDNSPIPNTGFRFNITQGGLASGRVEQNYTLTIPKFNCIGCTGVGVNFNFFGNLTRGTNATYTLRPLSPPNSTIIAINSYAFPGAFPSGPPPSSSCPEDVCVSLPTKWTGYNLTLSFSFGWNSTENKMFAQVSDLVVASIGDFFTSSSNVFQQDPSNSSSVIHTSKLTGVSYNNTLTTHVQPGNVSTPRLWWTIEVVSIYYPAGYNVKQVTLNGTQIFPSLPEVPFETEHCVPVTNCSQSLIAFNVTDFSRTLTNANITITSRTDNSVRKVSTLSGGVQNKLFTAGNQISIQVVNKPSIVNASASLQIGSLSIIFPAALSIPTGVFNTATGGNFTFTLPSDCGSSGQLCARSWSFSVLFTSGFDLGNATGSFTIDLLRVKSFTGTGGSNSLSVTGSIEWGNQTKPAVGLNTTLFAIDRGTPVNTPVTNSQTAPVTPQTLLYISNVTLVNGVITSGQTLILLFTIINNNASAPYNATLTIQHLWPGPQAHDMSTTFSIHPGDLLNDLPFNNGPQTYEAQITFTGTGVQVSLSNVRTGFNQITQTMTAGTSPVLPNAPHAGLFNITVTSVLNSVGKTPASFLLSPTYADVSTSLAPARYLYGSPVFKTDSNGGFSKTIDSTSLLGAKNLTVFVMARDPSGIVVFNKLPTTGFSDSTILVATVDSISSVPTSGSVTTTLHLKNNSTKTNGITQVIQVILTLQGDKKAAQNVTIAPGQTVTVQLTFSAPATVGSYTLTYSSPDYGGVLASQTLQVTILSGYLQLLLPAGIGVAAAIIVLGFLMFRGKRTEEKPKGEEVTKKAPSQKPKPTGGSTPTKSLTRTRDAES